MNKRLLLFWGFVVVLLLHSACQNPTEPEVTTTTLITQVTGFVVRNDNLTAIPGAIVRDDKLLLRDTSKSDGSFKLKYDITTSYKALLFASAPNYGNDTASFTLVPGTDTANVYLKLKPTGTSVGVSSGKPANIVLLSITNPNISIRGAGGQNESSLLIFEVRDSLGVPVGGSNKLNVNFQLLGGPAGGEYIFPPSQDTDPGNGQVTTTITSGSKAGVLQVVASATVPGTSLTIKSSPVRITISGGMPVLERFSIARSVANIAGGIVNGLRAQVSVIVGDKEGNPVPPGTAIYFTTTGGIIQPSAITDVDGQAAVSLITGDPRPTNGIAVITARTIGENGVTISKQTQILFSGKTRVRTPQSFQLPDSSEAVLPIYVEDTAGNPLTKGTSVNVKAEGPGAADLQFTGDAGKVLGDTDDPNATLFNIRVKDIKKAGASGVVTITVTVTSENGNVTTSFNGVVLPGDGSVIVPPPSGGAKSGYASSLTMLSISSNQVSVRGTGAEESIKLTFIARDSVGTAVELAKRAYITFQIAPTGGLGGGEFISPSADSTDAYGTVSTTFNAGTKAGVVQVIAKTTVLGRTLTSSPVKITVSGGLPVPERFSMTREKVNIPGLLFDNLRDKISVILGDKDGNPVQAGTAIYFTTTGGIIQPAAQTNIDGMASVELITAQPRPIGGVAVVTAKTIGGDGTTISKSDSVIFSGETRIIAPTASFEIPDSGDYNFAFKVQDQNGNPLSAGTSISVSVTGDGSGDLEISGDKSVILPDTYDQRYTNFSVQVRDKRTRGSSGPVKILIDVSSSNGNKTHTIDGRVLPGVQISTIPPSAKLPAQISVSLPTFSAIDIAGVGGNENSIITYTIKDSLGTPIDATKRTFVSFNIEFNPNSYVGGGTPPRVIPSGDSTDNSGVVRASIVSGTQAGVVKLIARVVLAGGKVLTSEPVRIVVRAGDPTQSHFSMTTDAYSFANFPSYTVMVADTFSNPVASGTVVYFHTWSGNVQGYTTTNLDGGGLVRFLGGNPAPTVAGTVSAGRPTYYQRPGIFWVVAQTSGKNGKKIADSLRVNWATGPIIATSSAANVTVPVGGSSAPITVTITDARGNPLPTGTSITTKVDFTSNLSGVKFAVSGGLNSDQGFTMPNGSYVVDPGPNVTTFSIVVSDLSVPGTPTSGQLLNVIISIDAPGIGPQLLTINCKVL
ncbi:MAG: Ig-like domain-containing protein [bacterium]